MSSSHQIDQTGDTSKFTITAFLAFVVVFSFVLLMSQCHGDFKPLVPSQTTTAAAEKLLFLLQQGFCNHRPFFLQSNVRAGFTCPPVPVVSVPNIAFLAV